ncbi:hypothetical protein M406DRAFT_249122 [Cryphonectria parasitica EP155]|uniref:Uncharacterized protein n=1 Tax=Cryphonectria parasitica (strain ATCC 38755 / EP155) TaxID=660469 RepID=A0A9P4YA02_CRYP1|nr:uncharacterized protein M406DRAFT_249122 [Cryphonectria parasitica EP155]KAF3769208.1 hypothetical protein M406DRAFT_249122 [Cryphonectria parasitica EP155]
MPQVATDSPSRILPQGCTPFQVILDFDGTITERDTIDNIGRAVLEWRRSPEGGGTDVTAEWQRIVDGYIRGLTAYDDSQPSEEQRTTVGQELAYLRGRRAMEEASLRRVRESHFFTGLAAQEQLYEAGQRDRETKATTIRQGFSEWIKTLKEDFDPAPSIHIVSVNFSASYIKGVLQPWLQDISSVIANEVQSDGNISAALDCSAQILGKDSSAFTVSEDKLAITKHLSTKPPGPIRYYFGDSTTDLECLIEYGGYVLDSEGGGSLVRALRRLGHRVPHTTECTSTLAGNQICWARNFLEILQSRSWAPKHLQAGTVNQTNSSV